MPNWVFNGLTIEGKPESVNKLVAQMNQPFKDFIEPVGDLSFNNNNVRLYPNPVFSFRNIIAPTDLEAYKQQPVRSELGLDNPDWWADTQKVASTDNSWYAWNIRNWGTKWDVAVGSDEQYPDTYMEGPTENGSNSVVYYNFNTAWSVAEPALCKLSAQYPDLLFTLSFEEETGWGGEWEFLRGEIISQSNYEWMCRDCGHTEEDSSEAWCESCETDICPNCNYGEPSVECETHKQLVEA